MGSSRLQGNPEVITAGGSSTADETKDVIPPLPVTQGRFSRLLSRFQLFLLARLALGLIFIYASLDKILNPHDFARVIHNYQLLPDSAVNLTAIVLPWLELILGSLLVFGFWLPGAVALANLLLLLFFVAMVSAMVRGLDIHCGCFSTTAQGEPQLLWTLLRDLAFLALGGYLLHRVCFKRMSPPR